MWGLLWLAAAAATGQTFVCSAGYACAPDAAVSGLVWAMKLDGNTNGHNCQRVCENALGAQSSAFYSCDSKQRTFRNASSFAPLAAQLGFACAASGGCWSGEAPGTGLQLVSVASAAGSGGSPSTRQCYYPSEDSFSCTSDPGNANCFGERYISVCPCRARALEEACEWPCPNFPRVAEWPAAQDGRCVERVNYWRARACAEGWAECPPAGLPPMTECAGCNRCGNSEAEYDRQNGAHKSFRRCGELVQGSGGGNNCAAVIDSFVAERTLVNGTMRCQGHCGPVLVAGCQTFFFGHAAANTAAAPGSYVLNWRSCGPACDAYCNAPSSNPCFTTAVSPPVSTYRNCSLDAAVLSCAVGAASAVAAPIALLVLALLALW